MSDSDCEKLQAELDAANEKIENLTSKTLWQERKIQLQKDEIDELKPTSPDDFL